MEERIEKLSEKLTVHVKNDALKLEDSNNTIILTVDEAKDLARIVIRDYLGT